MRTKQPLENDRRAQMFFHFVLMAIIWVVTENALQKRRLRLRMLSALSKDLHLQNQICSGLTPTLGTSEPSLTASVHIAQSLNDSSEVQKSSLQRCRQNLNTWVQTPSKTLILCVRCSLQNGVSLQNHSWSRANLTAGRERGEVGTVGPEITWFPFPLAEHLPHCLG